MGRRRGGKRGRAGRLIGVLLAVAVLVGVAVAVESLGVLGRGGGRPARVVIPRGASFRSATDSLVARRLVRSSRLFRLYASLSGRDRAIKPGTYELRPGASYAEVRDHLNRDPAQLLQGADAYRDWLQEISDAATARLNGWQFDIPEPLLRCDIGIPPEGSAAAAYYTPPSTPDDAALGCDGDAIDKTPLGGEAGIPLAKRRRTSFISRSG